MTDIERSMKDTSIMLSQEDEVSNQLETKLCSPALPSPSSPLPPPPTLFTFDEVFGQKLSLKEKNTLPYHKRSYIDLCDFDPDSKPATYSVGASGATKPSGQMNKQIFGVEEAGLNMQKKSRKSKPYRKQKPKQAAFFIHGTASKFVF
jgi:hypothetical protein